MLIGLAGRKGGGKSTLADLLIKRGFQRASFAAALKEHVSNLFDWQIETLQTQEGKEKKLASPVLWDQYACKRLEIMTGMGLVFEGERQFNTRRESLQFIGTDVLRKADPAFHVKEFTKRFQQGNFVCDDLRFANELETLKRMGGTCVYVMRPYFWDYSNHASEVSLTRHDFDYVVVNDGSKHKLLRKFEMFLDHLLAKRRYAGISRSELVGLLERFGGDTARCANYLNCSRDKVVWWATKYLIKISRNKYNLNDDVFSKSSEESAYWAGVLSADGTIKKHLTYNYLLELPSTDLELVEGFRKFLNTDKPICKIKKIGKLLNSITISSPYIIDDLKAWNIEPNKSKNNYIPDCIRNNSELLSYWLVGLIDGDGSIYYTQNKKNICITILASLQVIEFLQSWLDIPACLCQEKQIPNLFNLRFSGKNAVELYKRIYRGVGLARKWNKVLQFLDKKWIH